MKQLATPDLTKAQVLAVLVFASGQAVAWGWLTKPVSQVTLAAGATVIALGLKLADAYLRGQRAKVVAAQAATVRAPGAGP